MLKLSERFKRPPKALTFETYLRDRTTARFPAIPKPGIRGSSHW